jgi:hypothetical protein
MINKTGNNALFATGEKFVESRRRLQREEQSHCLQA